MQQRVVIIHLDIDIRPFVSTGCLWIVLQLLHLVKDFDMVMVWSQSS